MEVMEEGNLLDRVRILLQRDLDYYNKHQSVLQETLCSGVVGGLLGKLIITFYKSNYKTKCI